MGVRLSVFADEQLANANWSTRGLLSVSVPLVEGEDQESRFGIQDGMQTATGSVVSSLTLSCQT